MFKPRDEPILTTDEGCSCGDTRVTWSEIDEVHAFKKALFTTDLICLEFVTSHGTSFVLHEERPGWDELLEHLPRILSGFPPRDAWWGEVAFPPFATSPRILYKR